MPNYDYPEEPGIVYDQEEEAPLIAPGMYPSMPSDVVPITPTSMPSQRQPEPFVDGPHPLGPPVPTDAQQRGYQGQSPYEQIPLPTVYNQAHLFNTQGQYGQGEYYNRQQDPPVSQADLARSLQLGDGSFVLPQNMERYREQQFQDNLNQRINSLPVSHPERLRMQREQSALSWLQQEVRSGRLPMSAAQDSMHRLMTGIDTFQQREHQERINESRLRQSQLLEDAGRSGEAEALRLSVAASRGVQNVPLAGGGQATLVPDGRGGLFQPTPPPPAEQSPAMQARVELTRRQQEMRYKFHRDITDDIQSEYSRWQRDLAEHRLKVQAQRMALPAGADRDAFVAPPEPEMPEHLATPEARQTTINSRLASAFRSAFGRDLPDDEQQRRADATSEATAAIGRIPSPVSVTSTPGRQGSTLTPSQEPRRALTSALEVLRKPASTWTAAEREAVASAGQYLRPGVLQRLGVQPSRGDRGASEPAPPRQEPTPVQQRLMFDDIRQVAAQAVPHQRDRVNALLQRAEAMLRASPTKSIAGLSASDRARYEAINEEFRAIMSHRAPAPRQRPQDLVPTSGAL
jgi:hypothetical protein